MCSQTGRSALFYAAMYNHCNCVTLLLTAGAAVNVIDIFSCSLLQKICQNGASQALELLLQRGGKQLHLEYEDQVRSYEQ